MIVISRLKGEAIVVGHEFTVTVVGIEGDEVLLQIDGPAEASGEFAEVLMGIAGETKLEQD